MPHHPDGTGKARCDSKVEDDFNCCFHGSKDKILGLGCQLLFCPIETFFELIELGIFDLSCQPRFLLKDFPSVLRLFFAEQFGDDFHDLDDWGDVTRSDFLLLGYGVLPNRETTLALRQAQNSTKKRFESTLFVSFF